VVTVGTVCLRFLKHSETYYTKHGKQTSEVDRIRRALRFTCELWSSLPAADFGPLKLKAVQSSMLAAGLSRNSINSLLGCVRRCFKWAASEELISGSVCHGLATVSGLRKGRSPARETEPVRPVETAVVRETVKHCSRIVAGMIELQLLTGMRPAELCQLRPYDVTFDLDGCGVFRPQSHKTEHFGQERVIFIGPRGLAVLRPFLDRPAESYCFDSSEAMAEHHKQRSEERRTPRWKSHMTRNRLKRRSVKRRGPGGCFTPASYRRAVQRACERAFPCPPGLSAEERKAWRSRHDWSPNQLRHSFATLARSAAGLDAVAAALGHADIETSKIYAEKSMETAKALLLRIG
jgi:integrase